jgi:IMP and pyridine-specific 5'-nucleotidase
MKEILRHSFVLDSPDTYFDSFSFFERLVLEHKENPMHSRMRQFVPNIGKFHTELPLRAAFTKYDTKYGITQRHFIPPSFHELRHICNLAQVMALNTTLTMITFDGDQTLYSDGGIFEYNAELANQIIELMKSGVRIAVITAAGYGLDGPKYAVRLQGLLKAFVSAQMTAEQIGTFFVFGGECNYLLQAHLLDRDEHHPEPRVELHPVPVEVYQSDALDCPKPTHWSVEQVNQILDAAETVMNESVVSMKLRARVLRKERAVGVFPGGNAMEKTVPVGHGA